MDGEDAVSLLGSGCGDSPAGGGTAGPGPLEVEAAEVAGDVDDFADEVEARDVAGFHGSGGELVGVDAAGGDFGFLKAFGAVRIDGPVMKAVVSFFESAVGECCGRIEFDPAGSEALRQDGGEGGAGAGEIATSRGFTERRGEVAAGCEIDEDRVAGSPVGGDLEDGGSAEAAVGDEQFLAEAGGFAGGPGGGDDVGGEAGEVTETGGLGGREGEWDEGGAGWNNVEAEAGGDFIAEAGGTHFRDGGAAGGDDEGGRCEGAARCFNYVAAAVAYFCDLAVGVDGDAGLGAFLFEHGDDFLRRAVAEELP